jgi:hypothetical protein
MILLPPEIIFEKRVLSQSSWSYEFRHSTLGVLGRILLRDLPDGRGTHLSYEVAGGDPADPRPAQRRAIFEPLGLEIARSIEEIAGPYPGPRPVPPPQPVEAAHGVESKLMPCHTCGTFVVMLIFVPDATDAGRFEDYARLMVPEYVRHNIPTWIIGPALGPGPQDPADILKVWPIRKPITRLTPGQFNPRIRRLATRHCR